MRFALLLLAFALLPMGLARADDDDKKEDKKAADPIAGVWKAVSYEQDGQKGDEAPDYVLSFKAGKYSQKNNGMEDETGSYKLDTEKKPHEVTLTIESGRDKGKKQPGIFKVDGDKLTLCLAMPGSDKRPEKFEAGEGSNAILVTFKRDKE